MILNTFDMECDTCKDSLNVITEYTWYREDQLREHANDHGWLQAGGKDICPDCIKRAFGIDSR